MVRDKGTSWRVFGASLLVVQSLSAIIWWVLLWTTPTSRSYFRPTSTPDAALLAFCLPDSLLFIGVALWAAHRLLNKPEAALLPLALHTGAALFGSLYCVMQWLMTGEAALAALFMAPCLFIGPVMLWKLERD